MGVALELDEMEVCVMCSGPLVYLGMLGSLVMCKCRQCGAEQSVEPLESEDE